jgi:hypothetical protein
LIFGEAARPATFDAALREFAARPANEPRGDLRRERIEQWLAAG